ncbi:MAG TPA: hypothetical protein VIG46_08950 [Candidatus Baltobacteraceae bacterium]|jgi:hypothetical protein
MNERPVYTHVQDGKFVRAFLSGLAVVILIPTLIVQFSGGDGTLVSVGLTIVPVLIIAASMFGSMTIEVTRTQVRWRFTLGWPSGSILRADLRDAVREDPSPINGIGIHLTLRGWLWNVALGPAVGLRKKSGGEVLLGTDDPDGLLAALRA